jgi:tripartite-type tricarboxylate transporter receptor subunit TctC
VDNRPSNIAPETVAKAPADGYTFLLASNPFWIGPLLQKMSYDPIREFSPIVCVNKSSPVLVINPSVTANSVAELIKLAKANPGLLNYASSGIGAGSHMASELFKSMAGVNIVLVNYKTVPAALNDLIGGRVQMMIVSPATAMPHARSGKLRALAITSAEPSALVPELPTVAASGLPGYSVATFLGMLAPAKTSEPIINRINEETVRVINRIDVKEQFFNAGLQVAGGSPKEFAGTIKSEIAKWSKVINDAGIRAE